MVKTASTGDNDELRRAIEDAEREAQEHGPLELEPEALEPSWCGVPGCSRSGCEDAKPAESQTAADLRATLADGHARRTMPWGGAR